MEGVTNEIRNKIKAAVKAKLQEIGAYVDEELPDYIMVMIANRRSKSQMTSELSLFLGNHTDKFTDWLHLVLEKLEAFAGGNTSEKPKEAIATPLKLASTPSISHSPNKTPNPAEISSPKALPIMQVLKTAQQEKKIIISTNRTSNLDPKDQYVPMPLSLPSSEPPPPGTQEEFDDDCLNIRDEVEQLYHPEEKNIKSNPPRKVASQDTKKRHRSRYNSSYDSRAKRPRQEEVRRPERRPSRISSQVISVVRTISSQINRPMERERSRREPPKIIEDQSSHKNGVNSVVRVTARRKLPERMQASKSLILKAVADAQKSVNAHPPLKVVEPEKNPLPALFTRKYRENNQSPEKTLTAIPPMDIKQVDEEMMDVSMESPPRREIIMQPMESPPVSPVIEERVQTRFIVTLDGAPSLLGDRFEACMNEDDEMSEPKENIRKPFKPTPFRRRSTGSEMETQQPLERCKYWPNCRQGDRCAFHHPKVPCKTFPNCTFGDSCLFVHPRCKFDASCTRKSCPYTHSVRSKTFVPAPPVAAPVKPSNVVNGKTVCKFFPSCNNVSCAFFHPPACKYGSNCTRVGCSFHHPNPVPTANKLKWVTSSK